jgi:hypothetical protein
MNRTIACLANVGSIASLYLAAGLHPSPSGPVFWVLVAAPAAYLAYREARHVVAEERVRELECVLKTNAYLGL